MSPSGAYRRKLKEAIATGAKESLTRSELSIAREVVKGKTNHEVSLAIGLTIKTVKYHLTTLFQKSQVKTRAQFVAHYYLGYLPGAIKAQLPKVRAQKKREEPQQNYPDVLPTLVLGSQKALK